MDVIKSVAILGVFMTGCAMPNRQVRVIKTNTEVQILRLSVDDGDVMVCDNSTCRMVKH